jgi:hypothetical protein
VVVGEQFVLTGIVSVKYVAIVLETWVAKIDDVSGHYLTIRIRGVG